MEEEEPSEGEPELCLMGIIVEEKRKRETEERERMNEKGVGHCELKRTPLCINPDHDEKVQ